MARDLIAALWPASYMGVPFYVEKDDAEGGRRLVVNQFANCDQPFIQDLGAEAKKFTVQAYCVGDDYDTATAALVAMLDGPGPGILVLPTIGPKPVQAQKYKRSREKDRIGYMALQIEFWLDGLPTGLVSVGYLAQLVFDAADAIGALAGGLASQFAIAGRPSWIVVETVSGLQDSVAALDAMRAESSLDPTTSSQLGGTLADLYNAIPAAVSPIAGVDGAILTSLVATARAIGAAMPANSALSAFGVEVDALVQPTPASISASANRMASVANASLVAVLSRLAMLAAYVDAVVRATYTSRPDGVTARANLVERFDLELSLANGADNVDLYVALQNLRNTGVDYLSQLIATLAPIITVLTNVSRPSLPLAWDLYQDPTRAVELVARNNVRHPSYMPTQLEALAPTAKR